MNLAGNRNCFNTSLIDVDTFKQPTPHNRPTVFQSLQMLHSIRCDLVEPVKRTLLDFKQFELNF